MMGNKIKAILFDLVGTLIYPKDPVGYVYANVAGSFGFKTDYRKLEQAFLDVMQNEPSPKGGEIEEKKWWKNIVAKTFLACEYDLKDKFDDIFEVLFKEFTRKSAWAIYTDVIPTIEMLRAKSLKMGLISNFDSRLEIILKELDLDKYFDCLAYSGKVGYSKPDPRIFQFTLEKLNVLSEETLYVGDSVNNDYYPALGVGINAVLLDRENACKDKSIKSISHLNNLTSSYIDL